MAKRSYWQRIQRDRISRRRLIGATGAGAAGLAVVAACGGGGTTTDGTPTASSAAEGTPQPGGRWLGASFAPFGTLDPHTSVAGAVAYFPRIYNVLLKQSPQKPDFIFYDLAESFEQPDETTWNFSIRPGVKIAPNDLGVPERDMDADDAFVSFDRILHGGPEQESLPGAGACDFVCQWFDSHEAPDPQTYIIRTPRPYAWFLTQVGGLQFWSTIPPRELIEQDPERMLTNAAGAGPYKITGYSESEFITADKNLNYYRTDPDNDNAQLPYLDGFDTKVVPDITAVRAAFLSQQAYSYTPGNREEADQLLSQNDIWAGDRVPIYSFVSFLMNVKRPPWNDPNIRKAATFALNRQEFAEIIYQGDADVNGIVPWPLEAYALSPEELADLQPYDPELSKQLIRDAGHELPLKIKVMFPSGAPEEIDQHVPIWLKQMEEAGFEVELDQQDLTVWISNMNEVNYDATLNPNRADETPEFNLGFNLSNGPVGTGLFSNGLQDTEVDSAIEKSKEIIEPEELVTAIHDIQKLIYDKGPVYLPIVSRFSTALYWNFVKNLRTDLGTAGELISTRWLDL